MARHLAVARLFERHGVEGLESRIRQLMEEYRGEKQDILGEDRTVLVIQALLFAADIKDISDIADITSEGGCFRNRSGGHYQGSGGGERRRSG